MEEKLFILTDDTSLYKILVEGIRVYDLLYAKNGFILKVPYSGMAVFGQLLNARSQWLNNPAYNVIVDGDYYAFV